MTINVSIIIPSYNKSYELDILLYSIEHQRFDHSQLEVIVVDDGSTDRTAKNMKNYQPPFRFRYIRNNAQKGRSYSRNRGIAAAAGDILLLLDSDMIVDPDFVTNHVNHHLLHSNLVVTGAMHLQGVYSIFYPDYSRRTRQHIRSILKKDPELYSRLRPTIQKAILKNRAFPLLKREDLAQGLHQSLSFGRPYFPEIIEQFGNHLENYKLPWTAFLSGNVSLRKEFMEQVGGFDEGFKGWGFEDWEMGYRLHQNGAKFMADPYVSCYHQEHPVTYSIVNQEMYRNYRYYQSKHPHFETCLHATFFLGLINRLDEHALVEEYERLEQEHSGEYTHFIDALMYMFRNIAIFLKAGRSKKEILILLKQDPLVQQGSPVRDERNKLELTGLCSALVRLFDDLCLESEQ